MTDSLTSNPRAAFEKWLQDVHGLSSEWQEERNCYAQFPAHLAWCAWQAAAKKPSDETNERPGEAVDPPPTRSWNPDVI